MGLRDLRPASTKHIASNSVLDVDSRLTVGLFNSGPNTWFNLWCPLLVPSALVICCALLHIHLVQWSFFHMAFLANLWLPIGLQSYWPTSGPICLCHFLTGGIFCKLFGCFEGLVAPTCLGVLVCGWCYFFWLGVTDILF